MTYERLHRVAFYTLDRWAFGTIHKALCKEFFKRDIQADLIPWHIKYTLREFQYFNKIYDTFVTTDFSGTKMLHNVYKIPLEKIVMIAHGASELENIKDYPNDYNKFKGIGGISKCLQQYAKNSGIDRELTIVRNGISFDTFYQSPSTKLETLGYCGAFKLSNVANNISDLKRGYIAKAIANYTNIPIALRQDLHHLAMPAHYSTFDCLLVTSTELETCSLPLLEAAAAGRVSISAMMGINKDVENPLGYIVPLKSFEFISESIAIVQELQQNPDLHKKKCLEAQEYAREHYDWSKVIDLWIDLIVGP